MLPSLSLAESRSKQQALYFRPLPQRHGSFLPIFMLIQFYLEARWPGSPRASSCCLISRSNSRSALRSASERGPQAHGGRRLGILEQGSQCFQGGRRKLLHLVAQLGGVLGPGIVEGLAKGGECVQPVVKRGTVQLDFSGGCGDGASSSECGDHLLLNRRQIRFGVECVEFRRILWIILSIRGGQGRCHIRNISQPEDSRRCQEFRVDL
jgi:hypothetical protein